MMALRRPHDVLEEKIIILSFLFSDISVHLLSGDSPKITMCIHDVASKFPSYP